MQPINQATAGADTSEAARAIIIDFIESEADSLLRILTHYAWRAGLARSEPAEKVATELLDETVAEALSHVDRFDTSRRIMSWFMGLAANVVRRKQVESAKRRKREPLASELERETESNGLADAEFFDRFASTLLPEPGKALEEQEAANSILSLVSASDAETLRLAVIHGLSGDALARALGTSPGAARVRLHRALTHLRDLWLRDSGDERND